MININYLNRQIDDNILKLIVQPRLVIMIKIIIAQAQSMKQVYFQHHDYARSRANQYLAHVLKRIHRDHSRFRSDIKHIIANLLKAPRTVDINGLGRVYTPHLVPIIQTNRLDKLVRDVNNFSTRAVELVFIS